MNNIALYLEFARTSSGVFFHLFPDPCVLFRVIHQPAIVLCWRL